VERSYVNLLDTLGIYAACSINVSALEECTLFISMSNEPALEVVVSPMKEWARKSP
jgi:hypothetical protein